MMADTSHTPPAGISVVTALSDAFTYIIQGFSQFARLAWKFAAFVVVVAALLFVVIAFLARGQNELAIYFVVGGGLLLAFLVSNAFYITIVRNWLLGETDPQFLPVLGTVILRVVVLSLLVIISVLAIFVVPLLAGIGVLELLTARGSEPPAGLIVLAVFLLIALAIFAVILAIYLAGRLCPWMVAACVGQAGSLAAAWRSTAGAGMRIMGGMLALTIAFMVIDVSIEAALSPLLGVTSETFEKIGMGESLPGLFVLLLVKIAVFFPQTAASMIYCASVYRQASGR